MNGILSLIFMLTINSLDKSVTYNIANYIIDHVDDIEKKNIREISKDSYTSTTSIMKFCQLLGFDSYNDFKSMFVYTVRDRMRQLHRKVKEESVDELLNELIHLSNDISLDKLSYIETIDKLVDIIHEKKEIYIYGAVFPINLCVSFAEDMTIMGVPVHFVQVGYTTGELPKQKGVHLIVTYTGRFIKQRELHYIDIVDNAEVSALISREQEYVGNVDIVLPFPHTKSIDYDDPILLFILDMIKLRYYEKYYKE